MATYSWLTKTQAIAALQGRLSNSQFWGSSELWVYLTEALRIFNTRTQQWKQQYVINNATGAWINTGTASGSPRLRSVTDVNLYDQMCYMLLETPYTTSWQGTSQFNITALQSALQKRTNEVIQETSCNLAQLDAINITPGTRRITLADTVLEPRRIRFLGVAATTNGTAASGSQTLTVQSNFGLAVGQIASASGIPSGTFITGISGTAISLSQATTGALSGVSVLFLHPVTLSREDQFAFDAFEPDAQQETGTPLAWSVAAEPPLAFDVDVAPNVPATYDVIALNAAPQFNPPTASLLGVPDDWSWVPMYGALADVLASEPEALDRKRSAYCLQRYMEGVQAMKESNWMTDASINSLTADTPSLKEIDDFAPEWQEAQNNPASIVQAGMDLFAPVPGVGQSVTMNLVGNAPLLDGTNTYVQVARDDFEAVLNYAHHIALFKKGNEGFASSTGLLKDFFGAVSRYNKRALTYGLYVDQLLTEGERQEKVQPK